MRRIRGGRYGYLGDSILDDLEGDAGMLTDTSSGGGLDNLVTDAEVLLGGSTTTAVPVTTTATRPATAPTPGGAMWLVAGLVGVGLVFMLSRDRR